MKKKNEIKKIYNQIKNRIARRWNWNARRIEKEWGRRRPLDGSPDNRQWNEAGDLPVDERHLSQDIMHGVEAVVKRRRRA